jgi:hypothetical protein
VNEAQTDGVDGERHEVHHEEMKQYVKKRVRSKGQIKRGVQMHALLALDAARTHELYFQFCYCRPVATKHRGSCLLNAAWVGSQAARSADPIEHQGVTAG